MGIFSSLGKAIGGGAKLVSKGFDWAKENPELAAIAGIGVATGGFGLAGAGAAGGGAAAAGTTAATTGATTGAATGAATTGATAAGTGSMISNPYAQAGLGLLQGQLSKPDAQAQPVQMQQSNLMQQLQQQQGAGYQYRGLLN